MQQLIKDFLKKHHIRVKRFAIGVSGGADSLALALIFKEAYPQYHLVALTVDHQLRPTSRQEAEYVTKVMKRHGIEHHILTWHGKKPQTGIEEAAREARYRLLCDWCQQHQISYLAVAHHLLDQAETFLMRLQRGSGLFGLSSIQDISLLNGVSIIRPLLYTHPLLLKEYLQKKNISWVEDESNQCKDFLRVKMRQFLPFLTEQTTISAERLCEAVLQLQKARSFIEDLVLQNISASVHFWRDCGCSFDYAVFCNWHNELKFYILRHLLTIIGSQNYAPEAEALEKLIAKLKQTDFSSATLGHVYVQKSDLRIWLIKETRDRDKGLSEEQWQKFCSKNPFVRGIKIPYKLKLALVGEKNTKK